ncbi:hypothetical protein D910_02035 [Dendroctonus ponderosae]|uniref:Uncharacterized protein n=1 Tax=Dendroctonus ponderosae TaxID=77166 RepID=U4TUY8_DENPD|nr:hypothetical protein D910_02035 [Dendroctonus ponderosae]
MAHRILTSECRAVGSGNTVMFGFRCYLLETSSVSRNWKAGSLKSVQANLNFERQFPMHFFASSAFPDLEEVARELEKIEGKYSPKTTKKHCKMPMELRDNLTVLSKEFDSFGLPSIDMENPLIEILKDVVKCSRDLAQIHRNTLNIIQDKNIQNVVQRNRHKELYDKYDDSLSHIDKLRETCMDMKNNKHSLVKDIKELKQRDRIHQDEMANLKRVNNAKLHSLERKVQALNAEIDRLKELCGEDIECTKNELALKLLKKHKVDEGIYKSTIHTLQERNRELRDQMLNLKEDIILARAHKSSAS